MRTPHRPRVQGIMSRLRACAAPPPALCPHPLVSICHLSETGLFQIYGAAQVVTVLARPRGYVTGIVAHIGIQTITLLRNLDGQQSFSILTSHIAHYSEGDACLLYLGTKQRFHTIESKDSPLHPARCFQPEKITFHIHHSINVKIEKLSPVNISAR